MTQTRKIGPPLAMAAILVARYEQKTFFVQIFKILPLIHIWTMSELHVQLLAKILNTFLNMAHLWGFPLKRWFDVIVHIFSSRTRKGLVF